ncbi:MAG: hypothetical protein QNJ94_02150 [Alphaproteobacteria bacterium]|nr:hypothetical protein [Alphaproteobacteria bacterium]
MQTTAKQKQLAEDDSGLAGHPPGAPHLAPVQSVEPVAGGPIDEAIRIRDLHQFEIKLHYPPRRDKPVTTYDLECYIFVPHGLGIHRANYSKDRFYDDLQTHIRFKTPSISLTEIVAGPESPLVKLEASAGALAEAGRNADIGVFEYRLKLFCCILQSSLRDFVAFIVETKDADDRGRLVQQYLRAAGEIAEAFRALRSRVLLPAVPREARDMYAFGDEYVSLQIERNSYDLLRHLRDANGSAPRKGRRRIRDLIAREVRYREDREYPSIPTDKSDNEQLIFRRNVLKKYMQNVLFLDTRTRHEGQVLEHGLFGIAAGISMLFATAVLFVSQSLYGALSLPVFVALVIGYMFKDRIKEMLRVYFSRKVSGVLFDHKTRIYRGPSHPIGQCRESFDFVDEAAVPDRIMKIRDRDHITEIESDWVSEDILRYRKRIKLSSRAISAAYRDIDTDGINDIMRFNVAAFTRRMGDPRKELFVLDEDDYRRVKAERVYHLNMVLRYGGDDRVRYKRLRIVLNRRRIKRIETVSVEDE